ncbi:uncharacterized protein [Eleutherodactylus coqui]|uniref:uncharacterized protein n=1 Tax=Eleutherodactylus coqui TaxID=57060 RepID=UPI0034630DFB
MHSCAHRIVPCPRFTCHSCVAQTVIDLAGIFCAFWQVFFVLFGRYFLCFLAGIFCAFAKGDYLFCASGFASGSFTSFAQVDLPAEVLHLLRKWICQRKFYTGLLKAKICAPYCKITCGEDPDVWTRFEKNFASLGHHLTSLSEDDSCGEEPDIWLRFVQRTEPEIAVLGADLTFDPRLLERTTLLERNFASLGHHVTSLGEI